ncbi:hypothetical protein [Anditalea andensis]|uniref:Lipoprotein n=1 Tax=Anditalea andensis TaxID=1048983 RepID=A0A074L1V5_9BACT|nr:hypothetical protein [Anditalea andensis]KEO74475.1 hypothetical protein EL17_06980 [Anditalea andensis]
MKKHIFYLSLIFIISLHACQSETEVHDGTPFIKAGFGYTNESILPSDPVSGEDILMGQLPIKVVLKIEKNRRLRHMQLTNVIKYSQESQDAVLYDLTFESLSGMEPKKSILMDQEGNKIYKHNLNEEP